MWPAVAGAQGPGQSVRASVLLSRVLTEAGVKPTQPVRESGEALAELAVSRGRGEQTPMPES